MGAHRRPTEVRQAELTDAALRVIATQGIAALSTRTLAAEVGLSTGAIFKHFATLEALLDSVVSRVESVLADTFPPAGLPPVERLDRFVEARSRAVAERIGIVRLVLSEQFHLALPADGAARLARCVGATREFVRTALREGQRAGEIREDLDADALALVVMGTIQVLALSSATPAMRSTSAPAVRGALLAMLKAPSTRRARRGSRSS